MVALAQPYALLIADDDAPVRFALRDALERQGYTTYDAGSGPEAVEVARCHRIHVALVDMQMPGMSGLDTIAVLRRLLRPPIPCVLMSAEATREMRMRALAAEAYSFLAKPLDLFVVRDTLAEILHKFY